jgi:hypothetical protein
MSEEIEESAPIEEQAVEEQAVEAVEVKEEVKPDVDLSSHFAEIKRRERDIRARQNKLKDEIQSERQKMLDEMKANPMEALRQAGVSTESLANGLLDLPTAASPEDTVNKELAELKAWKEAQVKERSEREQQKIVDNYRSEVFSVIESDSDKYELLSESEEGKTLYWDSVIRYYQEVGEAPNLSDIADRVEGMLFERGKKLLSSKKFAQKAEVSEKQEVIEKSETSEKKLEMKTLSNSLAGISEPKVKMVDNNSRQQYSALSPMMKHQEERHNALVKRLEELSKK